MHRGVLHTPGTRTVEAQAHRFAGALLAPADAILTELPRDLDWSRYFDLKRRWGMSMAALVRRAKDLGVITDATYTRAMKQRSAHGWRKEEPGAVDRALPHPTFLSRAMSMAELSVEDVAAAAQLPATVVSRVVGRSKPSLLNP
jgi:Zn-dependent peptidase ImmA (M78 family)